MALAYAVRLLEQDKTVKLTNYAATSRSFRRSGSARSSTTPRGAVRTGWNAGAPIAAATAGSRVQPAMARNRLREALDELRDAITPLTEQEGAKLFNDVWAARDAYIDVILDRSDEVIDRFFAEHQSHPLSADGACPRTCS